MNRRDFIKRATSALGGLAIFGRPLLRGETNEMPVTLGNRSVAWHNEPTHKWGIKARRGTTYFIDWSDSGSGDDNNDGLSPETALFSPQAAIDKCTSNQEDIIINAGHSFEFTEIAEDELDAGGFTVNFRQPVTHVRNVLTYYSQTGTE